MNIIEKVLKLQFPLGHYVIVGSGPMAVLGMREAGDIDIAVTEILYQKLLKTGLWRKEERYGKIFLEDDTNKITIIPRLDWDSYPTTAEEAIASAMMIDGVPFMNLEELKKFKRALGREKDFKDIAIIENYQKSNR